MPSARERGAKVLFYILERQKNRMVILGNCVSYKTKTIPVYFKHILTMMTSGENNKIYKTPYVNLPALHSQSPNPGDKPTVPFKG